MRLHRLLFALLVLLVAPVWGQEFEQANTTSPQTFTNKTLGPPTTIQSPTITGTIAGTPTIPSATLSNPTITGTVPGGASYTGPTITNPAITGTVSGGASYTAPTLTSPTISTPTITSPTITGTVSGGATYTTPVLSKLVEASLPAAATEGKLIWLDNGPQGLIGDFGTKLAHLFGYNWIADSYSSLSTAVGAVGATEATVIFGKSLAQSANVTVPCTMHLWRQGQGKIVTTGTPVITICSAGHLIAPYEAQVFDVSSGGSVVFTQGGVVPPNWWGTDGTNDEVQINAAIASLPTQGPSKVLFLSPNYNASGSITIAGKQFLTLEALPNSRVNSLITGTGAAPLFNLSGSIYFLTFQSMYLNGNGLTGASGNGHAVFINGAGAFPFLQFVSFKDTTIANFKGSGLDRAGANLLAAGIYATEAHSLLVSHSAIGRNQYGMYLDGDLATDTTRVFKTRITDVSDFDTNLKNGLYAKMVEGLTVDGETLFNQNGSGNAGEGNISVTKGRRVSIRDVRLKTGNPWELTTNSNEIEVLLLNAAYIQHYVNNAAVRIDSSCQSCEVSGTFFQWVVPDVTSAKGIQVDQGAVGRQSASLRIIGNHFRSSNNLTIDKAIDINVATNNVLAPLIESNTIGEPEGAGGGGSDVITTGISIAGAAVRGAIVRSNTIGFFAGGTTTTGISLGASVNDTLLSHNHYVGPITTEENVSSANRTITIKDGGFQFNLGTPFADLGTPPNGTFKYCTDCDGTNPCAGAGSGAFAKRHNSVWNCG